MTDKVTFIPKTLPGEMGRCEVFKSNNKVQFASIVDISHPSEERIAAICPHYAECTGCHFLHTHYKNEIGFKKKSLLWELKKISAERHQVSMHTAPNRLNYRNRIQLHYDTETNALGFINSHLKKIIPVPNCKIPVQEIQNELKKLYRDDLWKKLIPSKRGHIELYWQKENGLQVSINNEYAHGGFSQVNREMNQQAMQIIFQELHQREIDGALDLFGGSGNLTKQLSNTKTYVVDNSPALIDTYADHQEYIQANLYQQKSLGKIQLVVDRPIDLLILDPPRSGFKDLLHWTDTFAPKQIVYMSCNPSTMMRDLKTLSDNYALEKIHLLDFFPSTYHYECLIFLGKKQQRP